MVIQLVLATDVRGMAVWVLLDVLQCFLDLRLSTETCTRYQLPHNTSPQVVLCVEKAPILADLGRWHSAQGPLVITVRNLT